MAKFFVPLISIALFAAVTAAQTPHERLKDWPLWLGYNPYQHLKCKPMHPVSTLMVQPERDPSITLGLGLMLGSRTPSHHVSPFFFGGITFPGGSGARETTQVGVPRQCEKTQVVPGKKIFPYPHRWLDQDDVSRYKFD